MPTHEARNPSPDGGRPHTPWGAANRRVASTANSNYTYAGRFPAACEKAPMHRVTRSIEFSYGHRILGHQGICRHLHGHNGVVEVSVEAESVDSLGMVTDFGGLGSTVKGWVDANLDHRMVLSRQDPAAGVLADLGEPVYLMDDNPTAENMARHILEQLCALRVPAAEVRLWETPSSSATYRLG